MEHLFTLYFHFIGLGLLVTAMVAGFILNSHYRKAKDIQSKATILRVAKPIGLISPFASGLMLITGIGNMHSLGYSVLDLPGWLGYKIVLYAIAVVSGIMFGNLSRKRGALVAQMAAGNTPPKGDETLQNYDRQVGVSYLVMTLLFLLILFLSIVGRLGIQ